jgi:Tol biopolymer transport system component
MVRAEHVVALVLALPLLAGATAREVARVEGANIQRPQWSPDGKTLSWEANYHQTQVIDLFLGDPATRQFERVTTTSWAGSELTVGFSGAGRAGQVATDLSFAPSFLGRMVYTASSAQHDLDLYVTGGTVIAKAAGVDGGADWSPDGRWIAFTSARSGQGDLYLIDPSLPDAVPQRLTRTERAAELYADFSPDSRAIVYVSRGASGDHLWQIGVEGGTPSQITAWPGSQILPRYAPNERLIAFFANPVRRERFDLYLVADTPGAVPVLLAADVIPNSTGPAWTPDGRSILYTARDDLAYNPISIVPVDLPDARQSLPFDTIGHGDLAVASLPNGSLRVAYVAQGRATDRNLSYKRLYVAELPP